jgi:hypothetical protein
VFDTAGLDSRDGASAPSRERGGADAPSGPPKAEPGGAAVLTSTTDGHQRRIFESGYQLEMHKLVAKHRWVLRIANLVRPGYVNVDQPGMCYPETVSDPGGSG